MSDKQIELDKIIKLAKQQYNLDLSIEKAELILNKTIEMTASKMANEMINGKSKLTPTGLMSSSNLK